MDRTIINVGDCFPFHTDFAEDLFECYDNSLPLQFTELEYYYISEKISIKELNEFTKKKYNCELDYYDKYKNDDLTILEPGIMYFSFFYESFIIPIKEVDNDIECIQFGSKKYDELIGG